MEPETASVQKLKQSSLGWPKPDTAKEALRFWDDGHPLASIEMGGIGPGYEQCIQIGVFEVLREFVEPPIPDSKTFNDLSEKVLRRIDKHLGLSEAQAGAIKNLAFSYLTKGYKQVIDLNEDRMIMVSKNWPRLKDNEEVS